MRDYGTASWEGGDAACDHVANAAKTKTFGNPDFNGTRPSREATKIEGYYFKDTCGKCGARRIDQQIGLEARPEDYVAKLVEVFREVRRVLHPTGTLWLNLGPSYAGSGGSGGDYNEGGLREGQPKVKPQKPLNFKPKDMIMIPHMVAMALQQDGWWLRAEIIWHKKAPMPASVQDRPTPAHEQVFLLAKNANYFYDADAIREPHAEGSAEHQRYYSKLAPGQKLTEVADDRERVGYGRAGCHPSGRNRRSVWTLGPESYPGAHFATFPTKLVEPMVLSGTSAHGCCSKCGSPYERITEHRKGDEEAYARPKHLQSSKSTLSLSGNGSKEWAERGSKTTMLGWAATCTCAAAVIPCTVLDPFSGSGTTLAVALKFGRRGIGIELNSQYIELARQRIEQSQPMLLDVT